MRACVNSLFEMDCYAHVIHRIGIYANLNRLDDWVNQLK
jgi:hypothetical protein